MPQPARPTARAQRVLSRLQRQRDDRQPGHHAPCRPRGRLTPDFEVIIVNDGSARRDGGDRSTSWRATYPEVRVGAPPEQPRLRRRAAERVRDAPRRSSSSTPTATRSTTRRRWRCSGSGSTPGVDLVNGYKISRSDPFHRIVIGRDLPPHRQAAVRPEGARRRLRLPADAALDLRPGARSTRTAASSAWR